MAKIVKSRVVHFDGLRFVERQSKHVVMAITLKEGYEWHDIEYNCPVFFEQERTEKGYVWQRVLDFVVFGNEDILQWAELSNSCKMIFIHYLEDGKAVLQGLDGDVNSKIKDTRVFVSEIHYPERGVPFAWVKIEGCQVDLSPFLMA